MQRTRRRDGARTQHRIPGSHRRHIHPGPCNVNPLHDHCVIMGLVARVQRGELHLVVRGQPDVACERKGHSHNQRGLVR